MNPTEHLLACLNEECCEVGQVADKSLRFGLQDRNVLNPTGPTNLERLIDELNDLVGVIDMLTTEAILPVDWWSDDKIQAKKKKLQKFMEYAREKGALQ